MLIYYKTWIYQCLIKQVKSPSTWSRVPNLVRIRQSGRARNRGVTLMALVAHFNLELHHMDVKTAFLNGKIDETIYMVQPANFVSGEAKQMVCKLKKSIYGLKQASRQ